MRTDYLVDALGSVVGTSNKDNTVNRRYQYKPYGARLSASGAGSDPRFQWVGVPGYRTTDRSHSTHYVRARHYSQEEGRWTTVDPLWPDVYAYTYCDVRPTACIDPTGQDGIPPSPKNCSYYKELCDKGYILACNSYYACLNSGNSAAANCARQCLLERLQARVKKHIPLTCQSWIIDHNVCFARCGYSNPCTNDETLGLLCDNLFKPGGEVRIGPLGSWKVRCSWLLEHFCSWPTPYPNSGIEPPPGKPWKPGDESKGRLKPKVEMCPFHHTLGPSDPISLLNELLWECLITTELVQ
ncbi:MAG: hypothetical protein HZC36_05155 [Armatimonadetes bacterium]|nr:hypothetical protein [Armatimonadota bacterium]